MGRWGGCLLVLALAAGGDLRALPDLAQQHADLAARLAAAGRRQDAGVEWQAALQLAPEREDWRRELSALQAQPPGAGPQGVSATSAADLAGLLDGADQAYGRSDLT